MPTRQRKVLEERLAAYLADRPVEEQVEFLRSHAVPAGADWDRSRLRQEIATLICSTSAPAQNAERLRGDVPALLSVPVKQVAETLRLAEEMAHKVVSLVEALERVRDDFRVRAARERKAMATVPPAEFMKGMLSQGEGTFQPCQEAAIGTLLERAKKEKCWNCGAPLPDPEGCEFCAGHPLKKAVTPE